MTLDAENEGEAAPEAGYLDWSRWLERSGISVPEAIAAMDTMARCVYGTRTGVLSKYDRRNAMHMFRLISRCQDVSFPKLRPCESRDEAVIPGPVVKAFTTYR